MPADDVTRVLVEQLLVEAARFVERCARLVDLLLETEFSPCLVNSVARLSGERKGSASAVTGPRRASRHAANNPRWLLESMQEPSRQRAGHTRFTSRQRVAYCCGSASWSIEALKQGGSRSMRYCVPADYNASLCQTDIRTDWIGTEVLFPRLL